MIAGPATPFDSAVTELGQRIDGLQASLSLSQSLRDELLKQQRDYRKSRSIGSPSSKTPNVFSGMSIANAARAYLEMVGIPKPNPEVTRALERGGMKHASKDFENTVRAALGQRRDFMRMGKDWALTKWSKVEAPKVVRDGTSRKAKVLATMAGNPYKSWTAGEIAKILSDSRKFLQVTMGQLKLEGNLKKAKRGYRLVGFD